MSKEFSRTCLTVVMPGQRQEKAEMIGKVRVGAGDRLAASSGPRPRRSSPSVARMNCAFALAVAGLAFSAASVLVTSPSGADGDVDVVGLKNAAEIGPVGRAAAQPPDRSVFVPERRQEGERKFRRVIRRFGQLRHLLFDFDRVQRFRAPFFSFTSVARYGDSLSIHEARVSRVRDIVTRFLRTASRRSRDHTRKLGH